MEYRTQHPTIDILEVVSWGTQVRVVAGGFKKLDRSDQNNGHKK